MSAIPKAMDAVGLEHRGDNTNGKHTMNPENLSGNSFDDMERRRSLPTSIKVCESQESSSAVSSVPFTQPFTRNCDINFGQPPRKFEKSNSQQKFVRSCSMPTISNQVSRSTVGPNECNKVCQIYVDDVHKPRILTYRTTG